MEQTAMKTETVNTVNGVKVNELFGTIDAVKKAPAIATFPFRASNEWIDGGHNRTTIKNFYGTQQDHERKEPFVLDADEPPLLLGNDMGRNPVEYALTSLAACVTTSIVYHAAAKGITIRSMESRLEGDIDLQGFLGIRDDVPRGYKEIRMYVKLMPNFSGSMKQELQKPRPSLLVLDERGFLPIDKAGATSLFQVIGLRYEQGACIMGG